MEYMQSLETLKKDDVFKGCLIVRASEKKISTNNGKQYLDLTLADKTGSINAKVWDGTTPLPEPGTVVYVRATGNEYNGRMQLRVEMIHTADPNTEPYDLRDLVPSAPEDPKAMHEELIRTADHIKDQELRLMVCHLLDKAGDKLLFYPAAKQIHHAVRGGLLFHTLTMLRIARAILPFYPFLNESLLFAGIITHDLAKIAEMETDSLGLVSDYSTDGKLIGHIARGVIDVENAARETGASPEKARLLEHIILSHHGCTEYGSPKEPMFPEALVIHMLDTLDAQLFEMTDALNRALPGGFSEKVWGMDGRQIYRIPTDFIES